MARAPIKRGGGHPGVFKYYGMSLKEQKQRAYG